MTRALAVFLAIAAVPALAYEGKWTPQQVLELGESQLRSLGLKVPPKKLWDPDRGTGLLAGTVRVNGCTGAFISPEGLLLTNHHCLYSILQQHSSVNRDLMKTGYLARSHEEELPGLGERVRIPQRFKDVTQTLLAAVPKDDPTDLQRTRAIEQKSRELVAQCEKTPGRRCSVERFDGGAWYTLVETLEFSDVRLVYAPPRAAGAYGGDVDNWQWPRHSTDFAIARVYGGPKGEPFSYWEHNVPYRPEFFFPLATDGVKDGDFVMLMGYPKSTYRTLIAEETAERVEVYFPLRQALYAEWAHLMEEAGKKDPSARIAVAQDLRQLHNRRKNAEGMLAALHRDRLLQKRREQEQAVIAWGRERRGSHAAIAARDELEAIVKEDRLTAERDFLLEHLEPSDYVFTKALSLAATVVRVARENARPENERSEAFRDRNLPLLRDQLQREQKRLHLAAEKDITLSFIRRALALPPTQRIRAIDETFGAVPPAELPAAVEKLLAHSRVLDATERARMLKQGEAALMAREDPLLALGAKLADDLEAISERRARMEGAASRLRPVWRSLVSAHSKVALDPDANGTLRVSFARVKGFAPNDAVFYKPHSTLTGMVAKHTGAEPFDFPEDLRRAIAEERYGKWRDPVLKDVPVNFLTDADTSNGNSGSPVVNARGQLVGVNFDRVWENVANDFAYNPAVARNISADVRCMLWMLDQVLDADELLVELKVRKRLKRSPQPDAHPVPLALEKPARKSASR